MRESDHYWFRIQLHAAYIQEHDGNHKDAKPEQEIQIPLIFEVVRLEIAERPHTVRPLPHLPHRFTSRRAANAPAPAHGIS